MKTSPCCNSVNGHQIAIIFAHATYDSTAVVPLQNFAALYTLLTTHTYENDEHDDVIKWKHFPRYWPFVRGIHQSPVNSPHKGQWRGALLFSLICVWTNSWVNYRDAGDLRRHYVSYDVFVMERCVNLQVDLRTSLDYKPLWFQAMSCYPGNGASGGIKTCQNITTMTYTTKYQPFYILWNEFCW